VKGPKNPRKMYRLVFPLPGEDESEIEFIGMKAVVRLVVSLLVIRIDSDNSSENLVQNRQPTAPFGLGVSIKGKEGAKENRATFKLS